MLQSVSFTSLEPGARLLILGAVHGDEKCGAYAIRRVLKEFEDGSLVIERGSVTFVPVCNPRAFDADVRFIDRNLNRYLVPQEKPDCYEAQLGNILCPLLEKCDVLLDLHSYTAGGAPFVFVGEPDTREHEFANCLGATVALTGWQTAYAASGRKNESADPNESIGTTEYARKFGAIGTTLECGQHKDDFSVVVAYRAIHSALRFLGLVSGGASGQKTATKLIEVKKVFYRGDGGSFAKPWKHLEPVKKGEVIAQDENNQPVTVPDDGYLVLPHADTSPGTEWFYWGQARAGD